MNIEKTEMTIEYIELSNSSSSDEQEQPVVDLEPVPESAVKDADVSCPRKATFLKRNLRRAHTVRRKQMPDSDEGRTDSGIPPSCIQLLNVESSGACLYTCGALTNARQVCDTKLTLVLLLHPGRSDSTPVGVQSIAISLSGSLCVCFSM